MRELKRDLSGVGVVLALMGAALACFALGMVLGGVVARGGERAARERCESALEKAQAELEEIHEAMGD